MLVWIPTVMTQGQKPDVVRYAQKDPAFPLNPTTDQLYDQTQFEAYRQLGHTAARSAFPDTPRKEDILTRGGLGEVFEKMLREASAQRPQEPES